MARSGWIWTALTACFLFATDAPVMTAAQAQSGSVTGATITWYGIYQAEEIKKEQDAGAAGGTHRTSTNVKPPAVNSDRIPIADNRRFGFGFKLVGEPASARVKLKTVQKIPSPGVLNTVTGKRSMSGQHESTVTIGSTAAFTGFVIGKAANVPPGNWTFEIWHDNRKLAEKTFALYRP